LDFADQTTAPLPETRGSTGNEGGPLPVSV